MSKTKSKSKSKDSKSKSKSSSKGKSARSSRSKSPSSGGDSEANYLQNPFKGYKLKGLSPSFTCGKNWRTIFFDKELKKEVIRCVIQINFDVGDPPNFALGAAEKSAMQQAEIRFLGGFPGTCGMHCFGMQGHCDGSRIWPGGPPPCDIPPVPNPAKIGIEVDMPNKCVSFLVGEEKLGLLVNKIPSGLHIGVSGFGDCEYKFISFQTLKAASPAPKQSRFLEWK